MLVHHIFLMTDIKPHSSLILRFIGSTLAWFSYSMTDLGHRLHRFGSKINKIYWAKSPLNKTMVTISREMFFRFRIRNDTEQISIEQILGTE